ncbi:MAG TPA: hypothetical protein ENK91_05930 [Bacteroidetes bacterium]|nr:hypothetical protein [Bacteroidota bacterium]
MILVVNNELSDLKKIDETSFVSLNIWERNHIQEWIREAPEILGEELLVVSIEFDRFKNSNDRLDILAIDRQGNIVVVELKRDSYAGYADLQAIRYAAMTSSMTIEKLLPYYNQYQKKHLGIDNPSNEISRTNIEEFVNDDNFKELSNKPRIILCSEDFSQEITTTVLWLNSSGLDISCVKIKPHKIGDQIAIVPNKIIPLQEAQQYLIDIQKKEEQETKSGRNRPRTMRILIENGLLKEGDKIYLKNDIPKYMKFDKTKKEYLGTITGKLGRSNAVKWEFNESEYSISSLTWQIFKKFHPENKNPGGVNGNWHWVSENGTNLWEIAEKYWTENEN